MVVEVAPGGGYGFDDVVSGVSEVDASEVGRVLVSGDVDVSEGVMLGSSDETSVVVPAVVLVSSAEVVSEVAVLSEVEGT